MNIYVLLVYKNPSGFYQEKLINNLYEIMEIAIDSKIS